MTHDLIYEKFQKYYPQFKYITKEWFPNGDKSIRVVLNYAAKMPSSYDYQLIFNYISEDNYYLETVDDFINRLKGE